MLSLRWRYPMSNVERIHFTRDIGTTSGVELELGDTCHTSYLERVSWPRHWSRGLDHCLDVDKGQMLAGQAWDC